MTNERLLQCNEMLECLNENWAYVSALNDSL